MAGKRKPLSPAQQIAITEIVSARKNFIDARDELELKIREQVREELAALEMAYAITIRRARALEIPKSSIGSLGMGTSDPHTVDRWLQKTNRMVFEPGAIPVTGFSWLKKEEGTVRVHFENFPTSITAEDYPAVLDGVARRDEQARNGWAVQSDPGTLEVTQGVLRGWFSVEIEDVPLTQPNSLTSMLTEWEAQNR